MYRFRRLRRQGASPGPVELAGIRSKGNGCPRPEDAGRRSAQGRIAARGEAANRLEPGRAEGIHGVEAVRGYVPVDGRRTRRSRWEHLDRVDRSGVAETEMQGNP